MPPADGRTGTEAILLCGHHYAASERALISVGAVVYDACGWPVPLPSCERSLPAGAGPASPRNAGRAATVPSR